MRRDKSSTSTLVWKGSGAGQSLWRGQVGLLLSGQRRRNDLIHGNKFGWIHSGVARGAIGRLFALSTGSAQTFQRQISERIRANVFTDLIHRLIGGDELSLGRSIDSVVTGRNCRRARDANVNFFCARVANHANDLAAGG